MNSKILITLIIAFLVSLGFFKIEASSVGLNKDYLDHYKIAGSARPCCNFANSRIGHLAGMSGTIGIDKLGNHHFARYDKRDKVGILYSCSAGFIDISHLRDNADWAAHIYLKLPEWLGSGKEVKARREGGHSKRSIYFPRIDLKELKTLTEDDLEKIAIVIGFDLALLHEVTTSFKLSVSVPLAFFISERSSSFSLEDAYSNLLGEKLGIRAIRDSQPYNKAMTKILYSKLKELGAQNEVKTKRAYELVKNNWWKSDEEDGFHKVLRRNFDYQNEIRPLIIEDAPFCSKIERHNLEVPNLLSNGKSVNDYFELRGKMRRKLIRDFKNIGVDLGDIITQKDYPVVIEAIKKEFIEELGDEIVKLN